MSVIDHETVLQILKEYYEGRLDAVKKGLEKPALSALLLEKFAWGMHKALNASELHHSYDLISTADEYCETLDPNFEKHRSLRYSNKNVSLDFGEPRKASPTL